MNHTTKFQLSKTESELTKKPNQIKFQLSKPPLLQEEAADAAGGNECSSRRSGVRFKRTSKIYFKVSECHILTLF